MACKLYLRTFSFDIQEKQKLNQKHTEVTIHYCVWATWKNSMKPRGLIKRGISKEIKGASQSERIHHSFWQTAQVQSCQTDYTWYMNCDTLCFTLVEEKVVLNKLHCWKVNSERQSVSMDVALCIVPSHFLFWYLPVSFHLSHHLRFLFALFWHLSFARHIWNKAEQSKTKLCHHSEYIFPVSLFLSHFLLFSPN